MLEAMTKTDQQIEKGLAALRKFCATVTFVFVAIAASLLLPAQALAGDPLTAQTFRAVGDANRVRAVIEHVLQEIVRMVSRRPCTASDIDRSFNLGGSNKVRQLLKPFVESGILQQCDLGGKQFYQCISPESTF